jgi:hypothetical protein
LHQKVFTSTRSPGPHRSDCWWNLRQILFLKPHFSGLHKLKLTYISNNENSKRSRTATSYLVLLYNYRHRLWSTNNHIQLERCDSKNQFLFFFIIIIINADVHYHHVMSIVRQSYNNLLNNILFIILLSFL